MLPERRTLGVFAKEPRPGQVKTRLAAALGSDRAASLYEAWLCDFLARLEPISVAKVLAYSPASASEYFERLTGGQFALAAQSEGDLGHRMRQFFRQQFQQAATHIVLVGSDSPDLPIERIEQAFHRLRDSDLVLGPSEDGGYYLIGLRCFIPELFEGIEWGTSRVLEATRTAARSCGLALAELEPWYDLDRPEDVARLQQHLEQARRSGGRCDLSRTAAILAAQL